MGTGASIVSGRTTRNDHAECELGDWCDRDQTGVYETQTVKCIRGLVARTIAKWEGEGWENVSQTTGKLRTEFTIRRPKPKTEW